MMAKKFNTPPKERLSSINTGFTAQYTEGTGSAPAITPEVIDDPITGIRNAIAELLARVQRLEIEVADDSQVRFPLQNFGTMKAQGSLQFGNLADIGEGFSGLRIDYPAYNDGTTEWLWAGVNSDTVVSGCNTTGGLYGSQGTLGGWTLDYEALTADSGNAFMTSGSSSGSPAIGLGASAFETGEGFWAGKDTDGVWKFFAGKAATQYLSWNGTTFKVIGEITATSGTIGGWTIDATSIHAGSGTSYVALNSDGTNPSFSAGSEIVTAAPARIYPTGDAYFQNINVAGTIRTAVFSKNEISCTAGTWGIYKSGGKLLADIDLSSLTNISIEDPASGHAALFALNDILRIKNGVIDTWLKISDVIDNTTYYSYTVAVVYGSSTGTVTKGTAVMDYGQSGNGFLVLTADEAGAPYLSVRTHDGTPWISQTERVRLGNLIGVLGRTAEAYGLMVGNNLSNLSDYSGMVLAEPSINLCDIEGTPPANLVGMNNGKTQVWISAADGSIGFAAGAGRLNDRGIEMSGTGRYLTQMATIGDESRVGRIGMVDDGSGKPKWLLDYFNPVNGTPVELLLSDGNGNFETGDLTDWDRQGDDIWEIENSVINSGSYAVKATYPYSEIVNDCYLRTDPIEVTGEKFYTLSAYQCNSVEGVEFDIGIRFYSDINGLIQTGNLFKLSETSKLNYTQYQVVARAPGDAQTARVFLQVYMPNTGTAIHYFDDVSLLESDESISSQVVLSDDGVEILGDIISNNISSTQWMLVTEAWTRVVGSQAVTASGNLTSKYQKGDKVKFVQNTIQKYFYVTGTSYSAGTGLTTISLCGGSDYTVDAGTISDVYYSRAADPMGFPAYFNYTVAWTATSNPSIGGGTLTGRFKIEGTLIWVQVIMTAAANTTFGTGSWVFSLPVSMQTSFGVAYLLDNGTADRMGLVNAGTVATVISYGGSNINATFPWTWATGDRCWFTVTGIMA